MDKPTTVLFLWSIFLLGYIFGGLTVAVVSDMMESSRRKRDRKKE